MFEALLQQIAGGLEARKIPYMLIGGQAVLVYGEPRLTRDIDVTLGVGPEELPAVLEFVRDSGWKVLVQSPAEFVGRTFVLPCAEESSGIRLDLIFSISPFERQAIARARSIRIGERDVRFAAVEDLIINKLVAGRPRDIEDVRSILLKQAHLDDRYIREWLGQVVPDQASELLDQFQSLQAECQRLRREKKR